MYAAVVLTSCKEQWQIVSVKSLGVIYDSSLVNDRILQYMTRTFRLGGSGILSSSSRAEIYLIFTATCAVLDETSYCNQTPAVNVKDNIMLFERWENLREKCNYYVLIRLIPFIK